MKMYLSVLKTELGHFIRRSRKAIVAAVVPVVSVAALKIGLDVDSETVTVLVSAAITTVLVYLTPNRAS